MIPNIFYTLSCAVILYLICYLSGRCVVGNRFVLRGVQLHLIAPIIGYAVISFVSLMVTLVLGFVKEAVIGLVLIAVFLGIQRIRTDKSTVRLDLSVILILGISVIAVFPSVIAVSMKLHGDEIFLSIPLFDHAKLSIISSILSDGFPIVNPFGLSGSGSDNLHYYFAWYFTAAIIAFIFDISSYSAGIINLWLTGIFCINVILIVYADIAKLEQIESKTCLPIALALPLLVNIGPLIEPTFFSHEHGLELLTYQIPWVPQHVLSAVLVCCSLFLLKNLEKCNPRNCFIEFVIVSALIAWGFGSSAYLGGIYFAIVCSFLFVFNCSKYGCLFAIRFWTKLALISSVLSLYFLYNYVLVASGNSGGGIGFGVWKSLSVDSSFVNMISYATLTALIYFGIVFIGYLYGIICLRKGMGRWSLVATVSFFVPLLIRSTISNNDLGWRVVLPFVIVGIASVLYFVNRKNVSFLIAGLCFIVLQLSYSFNWYKNNFYGSPLLTMRGDVFDIVNEIEMNTSRQGRLIMNTTGSLTGLKLALPVLLNRNFAYYNIVYAESLAEGTAIGRSNIPALDREITDFYFGRGDIPMAMLNELKTKYVVVTHYDEIFNSKIENQCLNNIFTSKRVKIFENKCLR